MLANVNVMYTNRDGGFLASLLLNAYSPRTIRYGTIITAGTETIGIPHVEENGRVTLEAKLEKRLGKTLNLSLSGRNLTDSEVIFSQATPPGEPARGTSALACPSGLAWAMPCA